MSHNPLFFFLLLMNESERSPPPKLSPFFPFFLSLLSSKKKKSDDLARDDGGGALASSSQPRARSHGDSHSSARFLAAKTTLFNTTNSRQLCAQFFVSFLSKSAGFNGNTLSIKRPFFVETQFLTKKGDFYYYYSLLY